MYPWTDRAGHFSSLKFAVLIACCAPMLLLVAKTFGGMLGSKPLTYAIHDTGDWAVRFLLLSLAVTPLRSIANLPKLILVRRMIGLTALAYVLVHFSLYVVEQRYDAWKIASEIVLRFYLTIGFVAILGLLALGITSTDGMIKRLGSVRWNQLHTIVYGLAVLALLHFFLQSKVDVSQPVLMTGLFIWLMAYRVLKKRGFTIGTLALVALAIGTGLGTALVEAGWYAARTGVMASRVLEANLDFSFSIRPAWWVLWIALTMPFVQLWRGRGQTARRSNITATGSENPIDASSRSKHAA